MLLPGRSFPGRSSGVSETLRRDQRGIPHLRMRLAARLAGSQTAESGCIQWQLATTNEENRATVAYDIHTYTANYRLPLSSFRLDYNTFDTVGGTPDIRQTPWRIRQIKQRLDGNATSQTTNPQYLSISLPTNSPSSGNIGTAVHDISKHEQLQIQRHTTQRWESAQGQTMWGQGL